MDIDQHINVEKSFDDSLRNSYVADAGIDLAEVEVDSLLNNELLKQIPVIKLFTAIAKTGISYHDKLFLKKIVMLLTKLKDVPVKERNKIIDEIDASKKYRLRVGEKLLYIIDGCEDYENSERVALIFKAFLMKKISYDDYLIASSVIAKLSKKELELFIDAYRLSYVSDFANELLHTGLIYSETSEVEVDLEKVEQGDWDDPPEHYKANVSGGDTYLIPTEAGNIIYEVFGMGKKVRQAQIKKEMEEYKNKRKEELKNSK